MCVDTELAGPEGPVGVPKSLSILGQLGQVSMCSWGFREPALAAPARAARGCSVGSVSSFVLAIYHSNRDLGFMALDILEVAEVPPELVSRPDPRGLPTCSISRKGGGVYIYLCMCICMFVCVYMY